MSFNRRLAAIILAAGVSASLHGAELPKPVMHATFDHDFRAESCVGPVEGRHSQQLTMETISMLIQPGVKGNAAKIGYQGKGNSFDTSVVNYPPEMLDPFTGTIAFWAKPLDWDFKDAKFHVLLEAGGSDDWLLIYKYGDSTDLYFLYGRKNSIGKDSGYTIAAAPAADWKKGTFRHVTVSWEKTAIRIYLDGMLKATMAVPAKKRPESFNCFTVGPANAKGWKNHIGDTLIDDLLVYDKVLSGGQIERLYTSYGYGKIDKSRIPVRLTEMKMLGTPDRKAVNLNFTLSRTTGKSIGFPVQMELKRNGKETVLTKTLHSDSSEYRWRFDTTRMQDGEYEVFLSPVAEKPTDKIEPFSYRFTVGQAAPVKDTMVPEPFVPVKAETSVWRRNRAELISLVQKCVFDKTALPSQLTSETVELLRKPVEFVLNGRTLDASADVKVVSSQEDMAIVETAAQGEGYELKTRCRYEFDGMMWLDVTLVPNGKLKVDSAKIQIALKPEVSTLYNMFHKDYYDFTGFHAGLLNKTVRCNHYVARDLPSLWMGNEERGLYYFTENQVGRRLKNRAETVRLDPGKDGALFTVNLIDYASALDKPVTWSFGLQVTPMRPYPKARNRWRTWSNVNLWFPWEIRHNVPDARFAYKDYDKKFKTNSLGGKLKVFHYFAGFSASPDNPGFPWNAHDWSKTPPVVGTLVSPNSPEWKYVFVCCNSESYRNAYIRDMGKCIDDLKIQHLYIDNCWSMFCANGSHGCGWKDEFGKEYQTATVLGSREVAKGIYRELKKRNPGGMVARHISQIPEPPLVSFADCLVDGECFMKDVGTADNYYRLFSPDFFRASFLGRQFGAPSVFIPQFERAYSEHYPEKLQASRNGTLPNQQKYYRHFIGYFLVHDSGIWPNFGISMDKYWKIFDRAGVSDTSGFFGYWQKNIPVHKTAPASEKVMVSSYEIPGGFLAVLMNDTDQALDTVICHILGKVSLKDLETGESVSEKIQIPARDFRLISIKK